MESFINEGKPDRIFRFIIGIILLIAGFMTHGALSIVLFVLAAVAVLTGLFGFCLIYKLLGINTCLRRPKE